MSFFEKFVEISVKKLGEYSRAKIERNYKILRLLKEIGIVPLSSDFQSIYAHALVEYLADTGQVEIVHLFAQREVRNAFKDGIYKDTGQMAQFEESLLAQIHENRKDNKLSVLAYVFKSLLDLKPEVDRFTELYEHYSLLSATPFQIKKYNEDNQFKLKILENEERKSFDYQVQQYLMRLRDEFQRDYLDNNYYISLNAETRKYLEKSLYIKNKNSFTRFESEDILEEKYKSIKHQPIDNYISNEWLSNDLSNLLVIIGEYGTGKTTFLRYMAHSLASERLSIGIQSAITDKKKRIPLYFPLRNFEKNIDSFIINQLNKVGITDIDYARFLEHIACDEFIILFDGFDEMTQKIDADEKSKNFDKIWQIIHSNSSSKVILTTRQEYFQSETEFQTILRLTGKTNISVIHLLSFDDDQIQKYLATHTNNSGYYWEQIKTIIDLHDLAKRPVLLQLIVDYLPKLIMEKNEIGIINASDLYRNCIMDELSRKSNELDFIIPNKFRLEILQKIAVWMYWNDAMSFDTQLLEGELNLKQYFQTQRAWEFEKYLNEFLTFTFLIREADNWFRISHKSFRDYLTACAFVDEINSHKIVDFGRRFCTNEIVRFIIEQKPKTEALFDLVITARDLPEEKQWQGTNAAQIILYVDKKALKGKDLSGCQLPLIDFKECDLTGTIFYKALLKRCFFDNNILNAHFQDTEAEDSTLMLFMGCISDISFLKELKGIAFLYLLEYQISDLSPIKNFLNLKFLNLINNQISDLSPLKGLINLNLLVLMNNQISDISPIQGLTKIENLSLNKNKISDISPLKELISLQALELNFNLISDISAIKNLINLKALLLESNEIIDISSLENLKNLEYLNLASNKIFDITPLKSLVGLKSLFLDSNFITDISPLKNLKNLVILNVKGNPVKNVSILKHLNGLQIIHD